MLLCVAACGGDDSAKSVPHTWTIFVSSSAPEAVRWAAEDASRYLVQMGEATAFVVKDQGDVGCQEGQQRLVLAGDGLVAGALPEDATDQTFRTESTRCGTGVLVRLSGGGLLGRQYAVYDWLRSIGVRFFHPEQEFVPSAPRLPSADADRTLTPSFRDRSVSIHLLHPLDLGDSFRDEQYYPEGKRYIDWTIKNLSSVGPVGVGTGELAGYGATRGYPYSTGIRLYGAQQGLGSIIDPDSKTPWQTEISDAIEAAMRASAQTPSRFGVSFDPTEFTQENDVVVVEQLSFIADYMAEHYPSVALSTINHGTHSEPTPTYGVRYYDLPKFAPNNLGVFVHTLMFYDVFRPAPVYGNENFNFLYDFMEEQYETREITYFPEAAWWLTFDIAVPLYLPITVEARDRDIQGIKHMLSGKLVGHHTFGTGHEWGFWQNEYCSLRMAADVNVRWQECFADLTSAMDGAGPEMQAVLEEAVANQATFMFDANSIRWLVGTDAETEAGMAVGINFHPLPPSPAEILRWSQEEIDSFNAIDAPLLERIDTQFAGYVTRLGVVRPLVPPNALPFFEEVVDGFEMFSLRAKHQLQAYGAVVTLRQSQLSGDGDLLADAHSLLEDALETTALARAVVARREASYRYAPLERSIAGGEEGDEDSNWTTYSYRYLNRTHHVFYYSRVDALVTEALNGPTDVLRVDDALVEAGASHVVRILPSVLSDLSIDWGDGSMSGGDETEHIHNYATVGAFESMITATRDEESFSTTLSLGSLQEEFHTGLSGVVVAPKGASLIEGVLPGLVFGATGETSLALGFTSDAAFAVAPTNWVRLERRTRDTDAPDRFATVAESVSVPIIERATGRVSAHIDIADLVAERQGSHVTLTGDLSTESVIAAVVAISNGAFTPSGARSIVASTLGYTLAELPGTVPIELDYDILADE